MKDGGPAFPMLWRTQPKDSELTGMTLRQYYKAAALASITEKAMGSIEASAKDNGESMIYVISLYSAMVADAMIKEDENDR